MFRARNARARVIRQRRASKSLSLQRTADRWIISKAIIEYSLSNFIDMFITIYRDISMQHCLSQV